MDPIRSGSSTLTLYIVQPAVTVTYMSTTNLAEPPESNNGLMESTFALIDKLEKAETGEPVSQLTVTSATQPHMGNSQPHAGTHSHTCRQLTATHSHLKAPHAVDRWATHSHTQATHSHTRSSHSHTRATHHYMQETHSHMRATHSNTWRQITATHSRVH